MRGDPAADGANVDADKAGDFGLGVTLMDEGDGQTSAVLKFFSRAFSPHMEVYGRPYPAAMLYPPEPL